MLHPTTNFLVSILPIVVRNSQDRRQDKLSKLPLLLCAHPDHRLLLGGVDRDQHRKGFWLQMSTLELTGNALEGTLPHLWSNFSSTAHTRWQVRILQHAQATIVLA